MIWFWVVVLVVVVGAVAVVAAGREDSMVDTHEDRPDRTVPSGRPLTADDLQAVRFSSAFRGYRMDEVDALIDRMAAELANEKQVPVDATERPERSAHSADDASSTAEDSDTSEHAHASSDSEDPETSTEPTGRRITPGSTDRG